MTPNTTTEQAELRIDLFNATSEINRLKAELAVDKDLYDRLYKLKNHLEDGYKAELAEANEKNEKLWAEIQAMNTIPIAKVQKVIGNIENEIISKVADNYSEQEIINAEGNMIIRIKKELLSSQEQKGGKQ